MSARILCLSDLHKRYKDSTNVKGQIEVQQKIQNDIIDYVKANNVTHLIILGDWYDRGFHGLGPAYGAIEMDRRISNAVNGNVFLCVGNHFYLERDENPEMYIIQPNPFIKPVIEIPLPDKPIFNVVPYININGVQITFFHYHKTNKDYTVNLDSNVKYHIGIYHDDNALPTYIRAQEGIKSTTSMSTLNHIYDNVDLAIHGHIHTKVGTSTLELSNGKQVPIVVPGALGITANMENLKYSDVDLPLIDISDNGDVTLSYAKFKTYLEDLRFFKPKTTKLPTVGTADLMEHKATILNTHGFFSLNNYLENKGYSSLQLAFVDAARGGTLDIMNAVSILQQEVYNKDE